MNKQKFEKKIETKLSSTQRHSVSTESSLPIVKEQLRLSEAIGFVTFSEQDINLILRYDMKSEIFSTLNIIKKVSGSVWALTAEISFPRCQEFTSTESTLEVKISCFL